MVQTLSPLRARRVDRKDPLREVRRGVTVLAPSHRHLDELLEGGHHNGPRDTREEATADGRGQVWLIGTHDGPEPPSSLHTLSLRSQGGERYAQRILGRDRLVVWWSMSRTTASMAQCRRVSWHQTAHPQTGSHGAVSATLSRPMAGLEYRLNADSASVTERTCVM